MNYADHEKAVLKKVTDGVEVDPNMTWDGSADFITAPHAARTLRRLAEKGEVEWMAATPTLTPR